MSAAPLLAVGTAFVPQGDPQDWTATCLNTLCRFSALSPGLGAQALPRACPEHPLARGDQHARELPATPPAPLLRPPLSLRTPAPPNLSVSALFPPPVILDATGVTSLKGGCWPGFLCLAPSQGSG